MKQKIRIAILACVLVGIDSMLWFDQIEPM